MEINNGAYITGSEILPDFNERPAIFWRGGIHDYLFPFVVIMDHFRYICQYNPCRFDALNDFIPEENQRNRMLRDAVEKVPCVGCGYCCIRNTCTFGVAKTSKQPGKNLPGTGVDGDSVCLQTDGTGE